MTRLAPLPTVNPETRTRALAQLTPRYEVTKTLLQIRAKLTSTIPSSKQDARSAMPQREHGTNGHSGAAACCCRGAERFVGKKEVLDRCECGFSLRGGGGAGRCPRQGAKPINNYNYTIPERECGDDDHHHHSQAEPRPFDLDDDDDRSATA